MLYSASKKGFYNLAIHGSAIPDDAVEITDDYYIELLNGQSQGKRIIADANGSPILSDPPKPTLEQVIYAFAAAVQRRLDEFSKTRNYDGILSASTYAYSTVPKFACEGRYAVEARDATWAKCCEILAAVEDGSRPIPELDELFSELPELAWPD